MEKTNMPPMAEADTAINQGINTRNRKRLRPGRRNRDTRTWQAILPYTN
jgi:hypothetical protein